MSELTCPACREPGLLEYADGASAACTGCGAVYPVSDGIPQLVPPAGEGDDHKDRQAAFFDEDADPEYEVTRPHGAPAFHGWLLGQKFRRSIAGLEEILPGATVLTVCGGSGMDAEFLARAGARVLVTDISLGAVERARERGRRFGFDVTVAVADVERLPFADRSVDVVYVHDGLHHLERPEAGLAEMARVARQAVSVTEPAQALATALAVRAGIALEEEEAGNRVERLTVNGIVHELERHGLAVRAAERYAMYYAHEPGIPVRLLSRRRLLPLAQAGWGAANRLAGASIGNKLAVTAVRP
jgi:SAM-dependent methyltransferase